MSVRVTAAEHYRQRRVKSRIGLW